MSLSFQHFPYFTDDIVALFKPYGIPMFGESHDNHHSMEKYLPSLYSDLETEKLFEVLFGIF